MQYDVVVVGAGPAGLAAAIRIKQLSAETSVCVLEKGSEVGAHILSGAVMDPIALSELIPDWKAKGAPLNTPVTEDRFLFLTETHPSGRPSFLLPGCFQNHGNYVVSLGNVTRWLGQQAEALGVEIFPGFAGAGDPVRGQARSRASPPATWGSARMARRPAAYQPGMELHGKYTFFAEGCRGHLGRQLEAKLGLRGGADPQVYGIGIKELWEVKPEKHQAGLVMHTAGWPLAERRLRRLVPATTWRTTRSPSASSSAWATGTPTSPRSRSSSASRPIPAIKPFFEGGKRISYGARAIAAGGLQSLPKLVFPGGALIGDEAGFLNAPRIKGSHCAIKSGMLAAEAAVEALKAGRAGDELAAYPEAFRNSWLYDELHQARNFKPWMSKGLYLGSLMVGIDQIAAAREGAVDLAPQGRRPRANPPGCGVRAHCLSEARRRADLRPAVVGVRLQHQPQRGPAGAPDAEGPVGPGKGQSGRVRRARGALLPGRRLRVRRRDTKPRLQINAQNCVHCKTCDIKDPTQNIVWVAPEGGGGPNYPGM